MFKSITIILCLIFGCTQLQQNNSISIDISESSAYFINGESIPADQIEAYLFREVRRIEYKGLSKEEIVINLTVHSEAKLGQVADLQVIIR